MRSEKAALSPSHALGDLAPNIRTDHWVQPSVAHCLSQTTYSACYSSGLRWPRTIQFRIGSAGLSSAPDVQRLHGRLPRGHHIKLSPGNAELVQPSALSTARCCWPWSMTGSCSGTSLWAGCYNDRRSFRRSKFVQT